jgi:hypothetical protein
VSLECLLARQAGVISRDQAFRCGLTGADVDRRVRTRRWRPLYPQVYLVDGRHDDDDDDDDDDGDEVRARAAVLWAGPGAVLSGPAAAWWHGVLPAAPATLGLTTPARRRTRAGVAVRCRCLAAQDRVRLRGLPVTARELTVLEAAVVLGPVDGGLLLDRALLREWVEWAEVVAAAARNPAAGTARLLAAATARSAAAAETALARLLRESGTGGWCRGRPVAGGRVGIVFPAARVAVRAVGWAGAPADPPGWEILRVGLPELTARPHAVLARIATAVRA